jgi:bisphosphoglycerate-dependent phosphoglycerate mutase
MNNKFYCQLTAAQQEQVAAQYPADPILAINRNHYTYEIARNGRVISRQPYTKPQPQKWTEEETAEMDASAEAWNNPYVNDKVYEMAEAQQKYIRQLLADLETAKVACKASNFSEEGWAAIFDIESKLVELGVLKHVFYNE